MIAILAHQGGWDEILLPALVVGGLLWASRARRRRESSGAPTQSGICAYCGASVPEGAARCPACGFRLTAG